MMTDCELTQLLQHIAATAEVLGTTLTDAAAALMAEDLAEYPLPAVLGALKRVRSEHAGRLTLKVVLDALDAGMGRPAPNEAWAIASEARDEAATVVWTDEIEQAWGVARPLAQARDMVGARMAFIAAYERICREGRQAKRLPVAAVSLGWDVSGREDALQKAVAAGRMPEAMALEYRQAQALALPAPVFNPLQLLEGSSAEPQQAIEAPPHIRERLAKLRRQVIEARKRDEAERDSRVRAERAQLQARKQEAAAAVAGRLAA